MLLYWLRVGSSSPVGIPVFYPLSIGLYADNFVYFSEDPAVETLFELHLQERVIVNFMGLVEWFLGIDFFVVYHSFAS